MFKIRKVKPLFTGVITTAKKYLDDVKSGSGLIDVTRMSGSLNPYQTVISVGDMCKDIKDGDVVKINFKRYAKAKHTPGAIDEAQNKQFDNMTITYEIPIINIDGTDCLFLQNNDIEYIVTEYDVDEGGLFQ